MKSWREVIQPRDDVISGALTLSEFAADLGAVASGGGDVSAEYRNPADFFGMTYLTGGLRDFLVRALNRVCGRGGDPVIQMKTAFGGGKTHSMLALYHMMKSGYPVKEVLEKAGVEAVPKVNVAVLAFNHKNPLKPATVKGITTRTLFGEIAAQLGGEKGYGYVRKNDEAGVSPGSDDLRQIFDEFGPCVVLMDELVAYGRKLKKAKQESGLPDGTYGNFITFIQELTEAALSSRNSLVVATLPESEIETVDEAGREVLRETEHNFARVESVWRPVSPDEGFEIVKRRLFKENVDGTERTITAEGQP